MSDELIKEESPEFVKFKLVISGLMVSLACDALREIMISTSTESSDRLRHYNKLAREALTAIGNPKSLEEAFNEALTAARTEAMGEAAKIVREYCSERLGFTPVLAAEIAASIKVANIVSQQEKREA